jgi:hypothetical protein
LGQVDGIVLHRQTVISRMTDSVKAPTRVLVRIVATPR